MHKVRPEVVNHLRYESFARQPEPALWQVHVHGNLRSRAQEAALCVAERLRDPDAVALLAKQAGDTQAKYPVDWSRSSLPSGGVGIGAMYDYVERCFPGEGWDAFTQRYLRLAALHTQQIPLVYPGLFGGTAGLATALSLASRGGIRYQKTLAALLQGLWEQVRIQIPLRPDVDGGVAIGDYDLVAGATGILTCLISIEQPGEAVHEAIAHLLAYLTWLAEPGQSAGKERWYVPSNLLPTDQQRQDFPAGLFNCGLAHGIPGALAVLALSWLAGYRYPGLRESIAYLARWLVDHQVLDQRGAMTWPYAVPCEVATSSEEWRRLPPTRTAWC
jgi:hypothetical protein